MALPLVEYFDVPGVVVEMRVFAKEKLRSGLPLIGTWNTIPSPLVVDILARGGLDFVLIDFEHGPFELSQVHTFVSTITQHGSSPLVRLPVGEPWMISQALDQGAHGIMLPKMESRETVDSFLAAMRFPPNGDRGFSPFTKASGFYPTKESITSDENLLSIAIVESVKGMDKLDEILEAPELDIVYFGAYDLSHALGVPGNPRHEEVASYIQRAVKKVSASGKVAGGYVCFDEKDVDWCLELGLKFITLDLDSHILFRSVKRVTDWFSTKKLRVK